MKTGYLYLGILILIGGLCLLSYFLGRASVKQQVIWGYVPDTNYVANVKESVQILKDYIASMSYAIPTDTDTVYIDSITHYGNIPITATTFRESITIFTSAVKKGKTIFASDTTLIPLELTAVSRGEVYEIRTRTIPMQFTISQHQGAEQPQKNFYGGLFAGAGYDVFNKQIRPFDMMGMIGYKKVCLSGRTGLKSIQDVNNYKWQLELSVFAYFKIF